MTKVYLDLGHGGSDPGAIGNRLKEKDLTLKIGKIISDKLKTYEGVQVKMSRTNDKTMSLSERTNEANRWGADILLSIHINAGGGTGFESFIFNGKVGSKTTKLQNDIHQETMKAIKKYNVRDRGRKRQNFHMVRESKMSACLTETLFIDNGIDAKLLKDNSFIDDVATGHVNGIVKYAGLKKKKVSSKKEETFYRVIAGSFKDKKNADKQVKELEKKGIKGIFIEAFKK